MTHSDTPLCSLSRLYTALIKGNMVRCEIGSLSDSVLDVDLSQMRGCEVLFRQVLRLSVFMDSQRLWASTSRERCGVNVLTVKHLLQHLK